MLPRSYLSYVSYVSYSIWLQSILDLPDCSLSICSKEFCYMCLFHASFFALFEFIPFFPFCLKWGRSLSLPHSRFRTEGVINCMYCKTSLGKFRLMLYIKSANSLVLWIPLSSKQSHVLSAQYFVV